MRFLGLMTTLLFLSMPSFAQDWTGISDCGRYTVRGVGRSINHRLVLVVNEKSASEIVVHVPILNEPHLAPYVDKALIATVLIPKVPRGSPVKGIVETIEWRIPNPIDPEDTGMRLTEKTECDSNAFDQYGGSRNVQSPIHHP